MVGGVFLNIQLQNYNTQKTAAGAVTETAAAVGEEEERRYIELTVRKSNRMF